jgi:hypothetical protein
VCGGDKEEEQVKQEKDMKAGKNHIFVYEEARPIHLIFYGCVKLVNQRNMQAKQKGSKFISLCDLNDQRRSNHLKHKVLQGIAEENRKENAII